MATLNFKDASSKNYVMALFSDKSFALKLNFKRSKREPLRYKGELNVSYMEIKN
jgi:hypothetical protein